MIKVQGIQNIVSQEALASLAPAEIKQVLGNIMAAARNHWIKLASNDSQFGSSLRFDYISGIQEVETKEGMVSVSLVGETAHMLEDGSPRLDLRQTLLGPNVPIAKPGESGKHQNKAGGYYRAIPFRHMTAGTRDAPRGKTSGQEFGSAYSGHAAVSDAKKLGKQVYSAVKELQASSSAPGQGTKWGGRLVTWKPGTKPGGIGVEVPKLKEHHKTDIYSGMVKAQKMYKKARQTQYFTFRTISTSVPEGWIRGAIPARKYADQVQDFIAKLAPEAFEKYLESL